MSLEFLAAWVGGFGGLFVLLLGVRVVRTLIGGW